MQIKTTINFNLEIRRFGFKSLKHHSPPILFIVIQCTPLATGHWEIDDIGVKSRLWQAQREPQHAKDQEAAEFLCHIPDLDEELFSSPATIPRQKWVQTHLLTSGQISASSSTSTAFLSVQISCALTFYIRGRKTLQGFLLKRMVSQHAGAWRFCTEKYISLTSAIT